MPTVEWNELEHVYIDAQDGSLEPNTVYMSLGAYHAILKYCAETPKTDFWETDDFVAWGRALYQEARKPKNSTLRQFLGTNRWERRRR